MMRHAQIIVPVVFRRVVVNDDSIVHGIDAVKRKS
jgi:hypothetical protein